MTHSRAVAAPAFGFAMLLALAVPFWVIVTVKGGEISDGSVNLYNAVLSLLVAWGVELDRIFLGGSAPFEYGAFMFFLWWALLPYYLFSTRRWRGLGIALALFFASSLPYFAAVAAYAFLGRTW
jgi:hypothetical protein